MLANQKTVFFFFDLDQLIHPFKVPFRNEYPTKLAVSAKMFKWKIFFDSTDRENGPYYIYLAFDIEVKFQSYSIE